MTFDIFVVVSASSEPEGRWALNRIKVIAELHLRVSKQLFGLEIESGLYLEHKYMLASYPGSNYAGEGKRAWYLPLAVAPFNSLVLLNVPA